MRETICIAIVLAVMSAAGCSKSSERGQRGKPEGAEPEGMARPTDRPAARAAQRLVPLWTATGLKVPESVLHDPARGVLYVSCINGKPTEKNGEGFIAKLSLEGKVLALEWAKGMNAPKGMGLVGEQLWVTDIDRLHAVDVKTGAVAKTLEAPETKFLNDIAIAEGGQVLVSDMMTGKIHVVRGEKLEVLADLASFKGSNGMLMEDGKLLVGTATGIARVDPADGKAAMHLPVKGFGMIDGLKALGQGAYLVSNWSGRTQIVRQGGPVTILLDTTDKKIQSADFEFIAASRTLLIPTFFDNRVAAYRLEP